MEAEELIKMRCAELQQQLLADNPNYKSVLQIIHENIREQPKLAYILTDEEISVIISGLSKFSGVVIAEEKKKEKITKARAAKLSADDV